MEGDRLRRNVIGPVPCELFGAPDRCLLYRLIANQPRHGQREADSGHGHTQDIDLKSDDIETVTHSLAAGHRLKIRILPHPVNKKA